MLLWPFLAYSQLSITGAGTYTIDFDNTVSGVNNGQFQGTGFVGAPTAGQLDSDGWRATGFSDGDGMFSGTHTTGDFARGTHSGGTGTGGVYAFETATGDFCLGVQPGAADFTPGDFTLRIQNNSGSAINQLNLSYEIKVFNDKDRSNSFNFSWSTDDISYTSVSALDYASPGAADPLPVSWTTTTRSTTLSGLNLANGGYLYLKWTGDDVSGSGSRDEFGLDDIVISGIVLPVQLVSFRAEASADRVELFWETATEIQNREFQVEHSSDGMHYRLIGSLQGHGTTTETHQYSFTHESPSEGINYYRLKQVDEDGSFTYSKVVTVELQPNEQPLVFYNPSGKTIRIVFSEETGDEILLAIADISGRLVNSIRIEAGIRETSLPAAGLNRGIYIVQLRQRKKVENFKIPVNP